MIQNYNRFEPTKYDQRRVLSQARRYMRSEYGERSPAWLMAEEPVYEHRDEAVEQWVRQTWSSSVKHAVARVASVLF